MRQSNEHSIKQNFWICYRWFLINFFQVYPEDLLPKMVCIDCCLKLNQSCEFFEASLQAQTILQMTVAAQRGATAEGVGVNKVAADMFKTLS
jgi:hypothetical protein